MADKLMTVTELVIQYTYRAWVMKHCAAETLLKLANI